MSGVPARAEACAVLDLDPDLGSGISSEDWELARSASLGILRRVPAGEWALPDRELGPLLGFVIVEGLVCREVSLRDQHMFELLGPGDVVLPTAPAEHPCLGGPIIFTAAVDTAALELGESFARAAARWPSLLATVHGRLEAQRENLAIQGLIAHLARAEHRLLLQLWHLADRWGRMTPEGVILPLPLTHDLLGQLSAARRPTVTLAVTALESQGYIKQLHSLGWLLTRAAEHEVAAIACNSITERVLGETLRFRYRTADARDESRALRAEARLIRARRGPSPA